MNIGKIVLNLLITSYNKLQLVTFYETLVITWEYIFPIQSHSLVILP